jgi:hypothetical protein
VAAPGRRAERGRGAHPVAGRYHHPLLRRRAAPRAVHGRRPGGELDPAAHRAIAADGRLPARPRPRQLR